MTRTIQYFAGLFDGEGCIQITKDGPRKVTHSPSFKLDIRIGMTDRRALDALKKHLGCGLVYSGYDPKPGHARLWAFVLNGENAEAFLRAIQPYCLVKSEEIAVTLEFRDWVRSHPPTRKPDGRGTFPNSADEVEARDRFRKRLQDLKKRFQVHQ